MTTPIRILTEAPATHAGTGPRYRHALPQLRGGLFATDGGLETTLVFHDGIELPAFAAFTLLEHDEGIARLQDYYAGYAAIAARHGLGLVLEAPTWRASPDWGRQLGYDAAALGRVNRAAIALMERVRSACETATRPAVISGNLGPRGDGYVATSRMSAAEAADYHGQQIATFADTPADMVSAFTINYVEEAIGIVHAAREVQMPVAISFTVETDGSLPSGQPLRDAIEATDAATGEYTAYYMINCAHPTHFREALRDGAAAGQAWIDRIRGLRANASCRSHAELDASTELDAGDPEDLGRHYRELQATLRHLAVIGGCCGTDHRHVGAICGALAREARHG